MNPLPTLLTTSTDRPAWHGSLKLGFVRHGGKTQQVQHRLQAPLKVQRPFYPEGLEICHSVLLHTAGGVVGGDRLSFEFNVKPAARALITTAAASKIYRSNSARAIQTIDIEIEAGAILEWLPQQTIVFNGAVFRQDLRVELAPGGIWLGWEITRFGRSAARERFCQGEWRSLCEIYRQGRPLWIDRQGLQGTGSMLDSPHGLAGQSVVGTLSWIGQPVTQEIVDRARSLFLTQQLPSIPQTFGVTRLPDGLLCRYRGASTVEARRWFVEVWQLLRLSYLGRPAHKPRVWLA